MPYAKKRITSTAHISVNTVVFVESLAANEKKTGAAVRALLDPAVASEYHTPATPAALKTVIEDLTRRAATGLRPILHMDAHGLSDKSGFKLESGCVSWTEFSDWCRELNRATGNHLLVNSAACYGLHVVFGSTIMDLTPFFAVVGPEKAEFDADIQIAGARFYEELFASGDLTKASAKLPFSYRVYYAEKALVRAYADYIRTGCTGGAGRKRIARLVRGKKLGWNRARVRVARAEAERVLRPTETQWEGYQNRFLMADLPANRGRFTITLADIDELLRSE